MNYVCLGATGLYVSRLAVGTAAFGLDRYGIPAPGNGTVDRGEAINLIACAADLGITLFDTAPGYGCSEEMLGSVLAGREDSFIATKVAVPGGEQQDSSSELACRVSTSIDNSLRALRRETLDILQIHNATVPVLQDGSMLACLEKAREQGKVRHIGASVYGEEAALAALETGKIEVLQIAVSLLDQRMRYRVIPKAKEMGVGILTRSALLKGALTEKARWLPRDLEELTAASQRAQISLGASWQTLPALALRFCVSLDGVHSVLSGIRTRAELRDCVRALEDGPLAPELLERANSLALDDERLLNPTNWKLEEIDTNIAQL